MKMLPAVFFFMSAAVFAALSVEAGTSGHWWSFAFSAFWFSIYFGAATDLLLTERRLRISREGR